MASIMAFRKKVSLVVPVLTSIYRGLNKISKLRNLTRIDAVFPIHFVYGWLALYFKTHFPLDDMVHVPRMVQFSGEGGARNYNIEDARKRIYKYDQIAWNSAMIDNKGVTSYKDDKKANEVDRHFFMAIRSNYLTWRLGEEFIVEPYSPHRFSRQFGYYQLPPGVLKKDVRRANLDDGIQFWRACVLEDSHSKAIIPSSLQNPRKSFSAGYKNWWRDVYGEFVEKKFKTPAQPQEHDASKECEKDVQVESHVSEEETTSTQLKSSRKRKASLDESSNSKRKSSPIHLDDSPSSSNVDPKRQSHANSLKEASMQDDAARRTLEIEKALGIHNLEDSQSSNQSCEASQSNEQVVMKQSPQIGAKSEFICSSIYSARCKQFVQDFWSDLQGKIARTPIDDLSSIADQIREGMTYLKKHSDIFDISHLEESVNILFAKAGDYDKARSASHDFEGSTTQRLKETEKKFQDTSAEASKQAAKLDSIKKEIAKLTSNMKQLQGTLQVTQNKALKLKEELDKLMDAPLVDDEVLKNLKDSKELLEAAQQALKDQKPFA